MKNLRRKDPYKFTQIKKVILFIWDYRCYICKYQSCNLHIHHIDKNYQNNQTYNLIPLCKQCHKSVHKNLKFEHVIYDGEKAKLLFKLEQFWSKF